LRACGQPPPVLVTETFVSIQGEGAWAGWPCFFIRLSGCNLRCIYCDTRYAYSGGTSREIGGLVAEWEASGVRVAQLTGGEPLLQEGAPALMRALLAAGAAVLLETNGSVGLQSVPGRVIKVVDRKTPGSGMGDSWLKMNLRWLGERDQLKFVITGREDYVWARSEVERLLLAVYTQVLFSPAWGLLDPAELASWILGDRLHVRFQIQLQKFLWGEESGK
jgi:7-carboxy-7-deazaguanine synthase